MINIPETNHAPPFRLLRASHAILSSRNLGKSKEFYTEVLGLVVSYEDSDNLYLRGLEERAHHSLVLRRSSEDRHCERIGLRVFDDEDLERAKHTFDKLGLSNQWADVPFQGRTLHVADPSGTPLELVARMDHEPRRDLDTIMHRGGAARRFDHYQITVPDVLKSAAFYTSLGFRIADLIVAGTHPVGCFLHGKSSPYDLVLYQSAGPTLHHFCYVVQDLNAMIHACDVLGELGLGYNVEYGLGKHGLGHSYFVYLIDPDGHRAELCLSPIVYMDGDDDPRVFDVTNESRTTESWGLPPRNSWFTSRSVFKGVAPAPVPGGDHAPLSLERYLQIVN